MSTKSSIYGRSGGISNASHYSPPASLPFGAQAPPVGESRNESTSYGQYGGVPNSNYYEPVQSSALDAKVPLSAVYSYITLADRRALNQLLAQTLFFSENKENILLRVNTLHLSATNTDSFSMATIGKPEDVITYTASTDVVNINIIIGGEF